MGSRRGEEKKKGTTAAIDGPVGEKKKKRGRRQCLLFRSPGRGVDVKGGEGSIKAVLPAFEKRGKKKKRGRREA